MTQRFHFWTAVLALGASLQSGCSTTSAPQSSAPPRQGRPVHGNRAPRPLPRAQAEPGVPVQALAHFATAFSHDLNGKPDLALEEYCQAALANPSYEPVVTEAARRCIRSKKPERAIEILAKATALPDASGTLYAWLGLAYGQTGKNQLAIEASRTAIKKMPLALAPYQNLAQLYLQNHKTNEAFGVLDRAARQPTTDAGFLVDLADLYSRYGRVQDSKNKAAQGRAQGLLDRAAKLNPRNPLLLHKLGDGYLQLGQHAKAETAYLQLLKLFPEVSLVRGKLADLYLRSKQFGKASEQLEAIAREDPTNPRTQSFLGAVALEENKLKEAAKYFERALLLNPDAEQVYYDLAGVRLNLEKPEEALALLDKARAKFKIGFVMEFYTAMAHVLRKKYPEAIRHFNSAEDLARTNEPARLNRIFYFQLGSAYERSGDHDRAERSFQKCLELSPNYAEAMNYLGYMWADLGVKLDQARVLIQKAVDLEPKNAAFLDSLGWVLFKLNRPKEALVWLLKAVENSPKPDPTLYDHLGDIHAALKEFNQAREAWRKSLDAEPNEQIKKKLEAAPVVEGSTP